MIARVYTLDDCQQSLNARQNDVPALAVPHANADA
jgi:hypothetical protein